MPKIITYKVSIDGASFSDQVNSDGNRFVQLYTNASCEFSPEEISQGCKGLKYLNCANYGLDAIPLKDQIYKLIGSSANLQGIWCKSKSGKYYLQILSVSPIK